VIRDRSKDVIKSGGEWISSIDLEKHLSELDWIGQCAVVAVPHRKFQYMQCLFLTLWLSSLG